MSQKKKKKNEITLAELAAEMRDGFKRIDGKFTNVEQEFATMRETMRQGFETLNAKIDSVEENSQEFRKEAKGWFSDLEKGLFTEEEKEQIMAMARHYDRWLEQDARGDNRITLTRPEYDTIVDAVHLPNRFSHRETVEVD